MSSAASVFSFTGATNCDAVEKNDPDTGRVPSRSSWRRLRLALQPLSPMKVPPRSKRLYLKPVSIGCSVLPSGMLAVSAAGKPGGSVSALPPLPRNGVLAPSVRWRGISA